MERCGFRLLFRLSCGFAPGSRHGQFDAGLKQKRHEVFFSVRTSSGSVLLMLPKPSFFICHRTVRGDNVIPLSALTTLASTSLEVLCPVTTLAANC